MDIKQFLFTRTDGENAGWQFVGVTEDTPDEMKQGFQRLHTHVSADQELYAFDCSGNYLFLSKVMPAGADSRGREKCFIHGYGFSRLDYKEIFGRYRDFISLDAFVSESTGKLVPISQIPSAREENRSFGHELNIRNLLRGVYSALLLKKSLCIVSDGTDRELLIRGIAMAVYPYLPLALRKFATYSSRIGGLNRKITITTGEASPDACIYMMSTGEVTGASEKYDAFIDYLLSGAEALEKGVAILQKYVEDAHAEYELNAGIYENAMDYVLLSENLADLSSLPVRLLKLLEADRLKTVSSAEHLALMLTKMIDKDMNASSVVNDMIFAAHHKTNVDVLLASIENYGIYVYHKNCSADAFEKLKGLKNTDLPLYTKIVEGCVLNDGKDFVRSYCNAVFDSCAESDFVKQNLNGQCQRMVFQKMARMLSAECNRAKDFFVKLAGKSVHADVAEELMRMEIGDETIRQYLNTVAGSREYYTVYAGLSNEARQTTFDYLVRASYPAKEELLPIYHRICQEEPKLYEMIEKQLSEEKCYEMLDLFYEKVVMPEIEEQPLLFRTLKHILGLSKVTSRSVKAGISKYRSFFGTKIVTPLEAVAAIREVREVLTQGEYDVSALDQLREDFWNQFDLSDWDADLDYGFLLLQRNEKSDFVKLMQNAADILRNGDRSSLENTDILCQLREAFYLGFEAVSNETKISAARKLQRLAEPGNYLGSVELFLILHGLELDADRELDELDLEAAQTYVETNCYRIDACMLGQTSILLGLYAFFAARRNTESAADVCEEEMDILKGIAKAFPKDEKKDILKRMKEAEKTSKRRRKLLRR